MKYILILILVLVNLVFSACRSTKQINKIIAPKDSATIAGNQSSADSVLLVKSVISDFDNNYIDFKTFSSKIKVDVETSKGKQPDLMAVVRIIKDSTIWMSVSATFLNIEVYRILITKDSVILQNKQEKEVQYRSLDYLQEVTQIPFDFKTIQDLLIGNAIFYNDSVQSFKKTDDLISLTSVGPYFKHLLTLAADSKLLLHSKLDDVDMTRNRTADITYSAYEMNTGKSFSNERHIIIAEKNKVDMRLKFKQVEFNKELSVVFNVPKNYTIK